MTKIHMHLGAHKTASTHLERMIRHNIELLELKDVRSPVKREVREKFTRRLIKNGKPTDLTSEDPALVEMIGSPETFVLCDENVPGVPKRVLQNGVFYPNASFRLSRAVEVLRDHPISFFIGIRNPAAFITSCYCETIRTNRFMPFSEFVDRRELHNLRWTNLVEEINRHAPDRPVYIWKFEDYRIVWRSILAKILDVQPERRDDLVWLNEDSRPGLSETVIEKLREHAKENSAPMSVSAVNELIRLFPKNEQNPAPVCLTQLEKEALAYRYDQDIADLKKLSNVQMIEPVSAKDVQAAQ